ncbi:MAG: hypothetical protein VCA35_14610 [Roseibacillus sp.]
MALKARFAKVKASEDLWRKEIIVIHRGDTVYWFCDLHDAIDYAGLRRLRFLLMRGETAFHVKSVANRPDRSLKPLITDFQI